METVIVDAGPLVAYLKKDDADHPWAVEQFKRFRVPLHTCDAVLSEAFFLLQQTRNGARQLLALLERGIVVPSFALATELPAVGQLMRRYEDVPMALADARLVRMAELASQSTVFTLDSDFRIYRKDRRQIIPLIYPE
ncbi:MAG: PIN domain-containing protein [Verrucomicrobia bacterium]|nr:PIN domain-containing protein [Verrucomicrobiota bacterium]